MLLDLNNGFDSISGVRGNPNIFADKVERVEVIFGTNEETRDGVVIREEPDYGDPDNLLSPPIPRSTVVKLVEPEENRSLLPTVPEGTWYQDEANLAANTFNPPNFVGNGSGKDFPGDDAVPLLSAIGTFVDNDGNVVNEDKIKLRPFTKGQNTNDDIDHTSIVSNIDVQKQILSALGIQLKDELISTDLQNTTPFFSDVLEILSFPYAFSASYIISDPVELFLIDGSGNRLGYSEATGAVTEIPDSLWLGDAEGIGYIPNTVEGPLSLELTGLGEDYFVSVVLETEDGPAFIEAEGFLAAGEQLTLDVPLLPEVSLVPEPRTNAGKDDVYIDSLGLEWSANDGLSGGRSYANANAIAQTDDDLLYQTEYYGQDFDYSKDVANGSYDVTLHFAETVFYQPGRRVFDVSAEDQLILDNFDIISEAGGKDIALERTFTVGVNDGTLELDFLAEVNNAKISAIEIKPTII